MVDLPPNSKEKPIGRLTFVGVAKEDRPVNELSDKYFEDSHYRVSHSIEPKKNTGPDAKQGYALQFETKGIDVTKRIPDDYTRKLDPPPKEAAKAPKDVAKTPKDAAKTPASKVPVETDDDTDDN